MPLDLSAPPARRRAAFLPRLCVAVFGLALAALLVAPRDARAAEPDYSGWNGLLQRYLKVIGEKGKPLDTRFDYEQLYVDEDVWNKHSSDLLASLHTQLLSVRPSDMTPKEQTAWAINAYNFLVVERLSLHLLVPGRKFMRFSSPRQVNLTDGPFFGAPVANVEGRSYTLTGFERRFVYGDSTAEPMHDGNAPREHRGDPRLMFALCKGALCTGPLLPWVYRADSLEAQLDRATRLALALPHYVRVETATGELLASNRFFEERADFGGPGIPDVLPFLRKRGSPATKQLIASRKLTRVSRYFEPDWKMNQFDRPKPKLPGEPETPAASPTPKSQ
jgi:hypothetical protein